MRGPSFLHPGLTLYLSKVNMPTKSQSSKKRFQKAEKLSKGP